MRGTTVAPTAVPPSRTVPSRQSEDYGFDDDDIDDDLYARGASSRTLDYRSEDEIFDDTIDDTIDDTLDNSLDDSLDDTLDEAADDSLDDSHAEPAVYASRSVEVVEEIDELDDDLTDDLDDELAEGASLAPEPSPAPPAAQAASRGASPIRTLNTYTFQYHAGIPDYDQSRPIVDPETGLQVGDCGMGVNMENNVVQNNPDNVVALDVWLVDKKQEKSFSSQDRVLLSEYVVDHSLEQTFTRERPNDPSPIIPQPGTTFQIKGPSLTLDCVVTEASYIKNGPAIGMFQKLSIDMTVRARN
jgi:hypothetical protein